MGHLRGERRRAGAPAAARRGLSLGVQRLGDARTRAVALEAPPVVRAQQGAIVLYPPLCMHTPSPLIIINNKPYCLLHYYICNICLRFFILYAVI